MSYTSFSRKLQIKFKKFQSFFLTNMFVLNVSAISLDRSCCHPSHGGMSPDGPSCPDNLSSGYGVHDFYNITHSYVKYYTRCQEDLCNDGDGRGGMMMSQAE